MSLTIYLRGKNLITREDIYIRADGRIVSITEEQWRAIYPNREPIKVSYDSNVVWEESITANLFGMAVEAGVADLLWNVKKKGYKYARELIDPLSFGYIKLLADPERYKKFNPPNGWGSYESLVAFVKRYRDACVENPDAEIEIG